MCIFLLKNKVDFTTLELNRLIEGYREMIVEINGTTHIVPTTMSAHERTQYSQITLDFVIKKLHDINPVEGK